ncbi:MAG: M56 family metallopeptidase, partial [Bacteroidales bacterium]|nr:M56 family metallopeptidase [Bacteroidales bacterium]
METFALFLPVFKFVVASALLALFYLLLFREKSTYTHARIFLLSIVFVSLLVSQFQIEVFTPPVRVVEVAPKQSVLPAVLTIGGTPISQTVSPDVTSPTVSSAAVSEVSSTIEPVSSATTDTLKESELTQDQYGWIRSLTIPQIAGVVYLLVTAFLFVLLIVQLFRILYIRHRGERKMIGGYNVIVHPAVPTPFSFLTFIFIGTNLSGNKLDIIVKHESWHIRHRHYIDAIAIELLVRIFWFNPVLWWVRKELRNIDEFQTDRSLLDDGQEIYQYQTTLLEEVMEGNPYLANGFNSSFIKKRFIIMKNNSKIRFTKLRQAMIVPYVAILFALFSFTTGKAEVRYVEKPVADSEAMTLPDTSYVKKLPNGMDMTYTIKTNVVDT